MMTKRALPRILSGMLVLAVVCLSIPSAYGQPPGAPGSSEGLPWQVGALFTANWVLAAMAVAMISRPPKRSEKMKKSQEEEAAI